MSIHMLVSLGWLWHFRLPVCCGNQVSPVAIILLRTVSPYFLHHRKNWLDAETCGFFYSQKSLWAPFLHKPCESQAFLQLSDVLSEHQSLMSQQYHELTVIIIQYCSYQFTRSPLSCGLLFLFLSKILILSFLNLWCHL